MLSASDKDEPIDSYQLNLQLLSTIYIFIVNFSSLVSCPAATSLF